MRRMLILTALVCFSLVLAACGSSGSDDELPTIMVLPSDAPETPTATHEPTQESAPVQETPEETEAPDQLPPGLPFLPLMTPPQEGSSTATSGLPFQLPQNSNGSGNLPFTLPQDSQNAGGLPFLTTPNELGVIHSDEPVSLYECPETTCTVLATLNRADAVRVISTEDDWLTVNYQDIEGYIQAAFVMPLSEALASGDPSLIPFEARRNTSTSQLPPGITADNLATQQARSTTDGSSLIPFGGTLTPPSQSLPPGIIISTAQPGINIQELLRTPTPTGN